MRIMKTFALWLILGGAILGAAACDDTLRGIGQDVEDTGETLQDAVD